MKFLPGVVAMKISRLLLIFFVGLVMTLALAACKGEDEAQPTPTATASPTAVASPTVTPTPAAVALEDLARAVVQVVALQSTDGEYEIVWAGSGTIIDKSGLILTNYHVVAEQTETEEGLILRRDELGVSLTTSTDLPPEPSYLARVVAQDPLLDLAVIQPYADNEGNPIDPATLDLPTIPLSEASELTVGQELMILGYPVIGGETITFTTGQVSGFLSQEGVGQRRAWIKTDATASPGNSGGAALDDQGRLVAIPTRATIDIGGFINRLRPVDLAAEVIERAQSGDFVAPGQRTRSGEKPVAGQVFITNLVFARDVTPDGELVDIVNEFPAGIDKLIFGFDFAGMQDDYEWVDTWSVDGVLDEELSGQRPPWELGESGTAWVSLDMGELLVSGRYDLEILVQGELVATATTFVGREAIGPSVSPISFAQGVSADDQPIDPASSFPQGTFEVYAFFDYEGAAVVSEYRWVWHHLDSEDFVESDRYPWEGGDSGNWWVGVERDDPLPAGSYELEIYFDDQLMQTGSFTVSE
jgi:S1-C subfamily serine protease